MTTLADTIAATLAEHIAWADPAHGCMGCGWRPGNANFAGTKHRAHLATVLAEQEDQRRKASLDAQGQWCGRPAGGGGHR